MLLLALPVLVQELGVDWWRLDGFARYPGLAKLMTNYKREGW